MLSSRNSGANVRLYLLLYKNLRLIIVFFNRFYFFIVILAFMR